MGNYIEQHEVKIDKAGFESAVKELEALVNKCVSENDLQRHIEQHPYILSQQFAHCRYVIPKVALGIQYETDFMCLEIPSSGKEWTGVELKIPNKKVITKVGRKTADLEHAIQQVRDWRLWVTENLSYARQDKNKNGLGLDDITPRFFGYVVIGRRKDFNQKFNELRRQIQRDELITIRSWDGIVERAYERAKFYSYIVDSRRVIKMQQELSEKQKKCTDQEKLITEIEHLENMIKLLDENIALNEREYKRVVAKIEDDFSDKTKESISLFLENGKAHEDIYQEVKNIISPDIPFEIFQVYLNEKKKKL
jgi:uncharacterized protein YeeX (DUF496 family)